MARTRLKTEQPKPPITRKEKPNLLRGSADFFLPTSGVSADMHIIHNKVPYQFDQSVEVQIEQVHHWNRQLIEEISLEGRSPERDTQLLDGLRLGSYLKNLRSDA